MLTTFTLLLTLTDPLAMFEGAKPTWQWEYPTNAPATFRMMTNGVAFFEFPPGSFNLTGSTNTNDVFVGKAPVGLPLGEFNFTLRAVDQNVVSDDSPAVAILTVPIVLTVAGIDPFKATFAGNRGVLYQIEGLTGIGATWELLGTASEYPPLSGLFSFVDPEKRTNIFYRVRTP